MPRQGAAYEANSAAWTASKSFSRPRSRSQASGPPGPHHGRHPAPGMLLREEADYAHFARRARRARVAENPLLHCAPAMTRGLALDRGPWGLGTDPRMVLRPPGPGCHPASFDGGRAHGIAQRVGAESCP